MNRFGSTTIKDLKAEIGEDWLICPYMSNITYYTDYNGDRRMNASNAIPCLKENCAKYHKCQG